MKLSVVIPVKADNGTLEHTLRSVLEQDYQNLEVIVSNNSRQKSVNDLVSKLTDPRIVLVEPEVEMRFSEDWEFALSHITGDYVTLLGDDDAVVPSGFKVAAQIIQNYELSALVWRKFNYCWPDHIRIDRRNLLKGRSINSLRFIDARKALNLVSQSQFGYNELPCIYNSLIKTSVVKEVISKSKNRMFFGGVIPDVYSGIVVASFIDFYAYSEFPITLNAASSKSSGVLQSKKNLTKNQKKHIADVLNSGQKYDHRLGDFNTSINSIVLGEYLLASENLKGFRGRQPSWLLFILALRREVKNSHEPERICNAIRYTQKKTRIYLPIPKFSLKNNLSVSREIQCNFSLPDNITNSFLASQLLTNTIPMSEEVEIMSIKRQLKRWFSETKSTLKSIYKIYRTSYSFRNK